VGWAELRSTGLLSVYHSVAIPVPYMLKRLAATGFLLPIKTPGYASLTRGYQKGLPVGQL
jgi:hypothetical protein